jgi:hypothetical protein
MPDTPDNANCAYPNIVALTRRFQYFFAEELSWADR